MIIKESEKRWSFDECPNHFWVQEESIKFYSVHLHNIKNYFITKRTLTQPSKRSKNTLPQSYLTFSKAGKIVSIRISFHEIDFNSFRDNDNTDSKPWWNNTHTLCKTDSPINQVNSPVLCAIQHCSFGSD